MQKKGRNAKKKGCKKVRDQNNNAKFQCKMPM